MPIRPDLLVCSILISGIFFTAVPLSALAQTIKRNPDGTVEVSDDETTLAPQPVSTSYKKSAAGKSSKAPAKRGAASGRIPAYTKKMGGVTVHRNPDGTIEVVDNEMKSAPVSRTSGRKGGTSYGNGVALTRHPDGRVDVHDTTMSTHGSSGSRAAVKSGRVGAYKANHGDVSVKRNADGTVEVTDTSSSTRRK